MILSEIRDYIRQRQQVSLTDLVNHFDSDPQAIEQMLAVWINKGKIHRSLATASCGSSCNQCESSNTVYFCWGAQPLTLGHHSLPVSCPGKNSNQ